MEELTFDIRGHLYPYRKVNLALEELRETFVESFDAASTRHTLFERYISYLNDFKSQVSGDFVQWINGSFVTNRLNPDDIDFITLLDFKVYESKNDLIRQQFENQASIDKYGLDAYLVRCYPENHKFYIRTQSDLLYWEHWFSNSKPNRAKKRFSKGFIEIVFKNDIT